MNYSFHSGARRAISSRTGGLVGQPRGPQVGGAAVGRRLAHHRLHRREEGQVQPAVGEGGRDAHAHALRYRQRVSCVTCRAICRPTFRYRIVELILYGLHQRSCAFSRIW